MNNLIKLILLIAFIVFVVVIGPLATIWAVNTLFPTLAIPYTIWTWVAVVIIGAFLKGKVSYSK